MAVSEASIRWALPIQEREAAGMATEMRWPADSSAVTSGSMYGERRLDGGPSSLTT